MDAAPKITGNGYVYETLGSAAFVTIRRHKSPRGAATLKLPPSPAIVGYTMCVPSMSMVTHLLYALNKLVKYFCIHPMERMEEEVIDSEYRACQHFISNTVWDYRSLISKIALE